MPTPMKLFEPAIVRGAIGSAFGKLDPRTQARNPVMFVVLVGSVLVTLRFGVNLASGGGPGGISFTGQVALWLWFTVLFANFAEAMAEGRGKAQADELRKTRRDTTARRLRADGGHRGRARLPAPGRRPGGGRRRRGHPRRRRGGRGDRLGRRVGHHRRVGPGHPRGRRGPLGGHRRDPGAVGLDPGAGHRRAGQELPRPDDRPGRGGRAAEDAQRDRPVDPAQRAHHHLPDRGRDPGSRSPSTPASRPTLWC